MPHPVISARTATPSVQLGRYVDSKSKGLAGFQEAIGKLQRTDRGSAPELSVDKNGHPRIDRGPQGPVEWIVSFIKDLIFPHLETEKRQNALRGLESAIQEHSRSSGLGEEQTDAINKQISVVKANLNAIGTQGVDVDVYNQSLRNLNRMFA